MTVPTQSDTLPEARGPNIRLSAPVQPALVTYAGQFASLNTHAVAGAGGTMAPYTGAVGESFIGTFSDEASAFGLAENNVDGGGKILKRQTVTGVTAIGADTGKAVYLLDSGAPFVLAPIAGEPPVGLVLRVNAADDADVWIFGMEARWIMELLSVGGFAAFGSRVGIA